MIEVRQESWGLILLTPPKKNYLLSGEDTTKAGDKKKAAGYLAALLKLNKDIQV
jgi:hypothetical protein